MLGEKIILYGLTKNKIKSVTSDCKRPNNFLKVKHKDMKPNSEIQQTSEWSQNYIKNFY